MAITPSIVELERRTKAQNVGDSMAYRGIILNFQYNFQFNNLLRPQNGGHFFDAYDVIGDVTVWRQCWPSIFMFEWNYDIFHNNYKTYWHMII